jgi:hypothetical protein
MADSSIVAGYLSAQYITVNNNQLLGPHKSQKINTFEIIVLVVPGSNRQSVVF